RKIERLGAGPGYIDSLSNGSVGQRYPCTGFALYTIAFLRSKFWLLTPDFCILYFEFFKGCWLQAPGFWLQPAVVRSL
ncbi:MAG: hypothetical protein AB1765_08455, partial [Candidatus Hydrogenedentota bacterium]